MTYDELKLLTVGELLQRLSETVRIAQNHFPIDTLCSVPVSPENPPLLLLLGDFEIRARLCPELACGCPRDAYRNDLCPHGNSAILGRQK